jgi:hypothetical protein
VLQHREEGVVVGIHHKKWDNSLPEEARGKHKGISAWARQSDGMCKTIGELNQSLNNLWTRRDTMEDTMIHNGIRTLMDKIGVEQLASARCVDH